MLEKRNAILALILLIPAPSFGTLMGMVWAEGTTLGNVCYMTSKAWVALLPVVWLMLVDRKRPSIPRPSGRGMVAGIVTGSLIFVAIGGAYLLFARSWIDVEHMRQEAADMDLDVLRYLGLSVYLIAINSLLEEYVWRWFVVTRCEVLMPRWWAVVVSGLLFTLHHVFALAVYFEDWRIIVLASTGVGVGGMTWSWIYIRYRNIWAAYVSHVFADVVILAIGYQLLFT